jgi:UDP-N-acetylmuramate dehydrogenase
MVAEFFRNINCRGDFRGTYRFNEPMADHTSFKTGGPADLWVRPEGDSFPAYAALLLAEARREGIPVFILGGGANIVVSDRGIRGIVLDTGGYSGEFSSLLIPHSYLTFNSGTVVDDAVEAAAARGLSGLEFLAGMPGSIGGALWMNARCYDRSVSDVLAGAEYADFAGDSEESLAPQELPVRQEDFSYKKSPFQGRDWLILKARFRLEPAEEGPIRSRMAEHRRDRELKGHFRCPSAGSVFKNNHEFGRPTGKIIDELGLKGLAVGDAQVAPWHGNIIINRGKARAEDIKKLVEELQDRVKTALGLDLHSEILFIGEWE